MWGQAWLRGQGVHWAVSPGWMPSGVASAPLVSLGQNYVQLQLLITSLSPAPWLVAVELWEASLDTLPSPGNWTCRWEADCRQHHPRLVGSRPPGGLWDAGGHITQTLACTRDVGLLHLRGSPHGRGARERPHCAPQVPGLESAS